MSEQDKFGFRFWLLWILSFIVSFLLSATVWTWTIAKLFGDISQPELLVTWALAVFGSWFLILTPFMRKKERIWKRLNHDEEKAVSAWLAAMGSFIAALIAVCFFWDWKLQNRLFLTSGLDGVWVKNVFASWLVLTLPLLVFLYKKADQIYKAALKRQAQWGPKFQTGYLEKSKRQLPEAIAAKIRTFPETLKEGHVLQLTLRDGRKIPHVFVLRASEVLGAYDAKEFPFDLTQVVDAEPVTEMPVYEEDRWLRLDGRA